LYGAEVGGVLANDSDPEGDSLRSTLISGPAHGTVELDDSGALVYTLDANFSGIDHFTYIATDGDLISNVATATITVREVNDVPLVIDEAVTTPEERAIYGTVSATDADHPGLLFSLESGPSHGTLKLGPAAYYAYTPDVDFNGTDSFSVRATNSEGVFDIGTITVSVTPVNDAPLAFDDDFTIDENASLVVNVAPATSLHFESEPGDSIGQGRTRDFSTANAVFTAGANKSGIHLTVQDLSERSWWYLDFEAPVGTPLVPGHYTGAVRSAHASPGHPGLDVSGEGRGSNTVTGEFTVYEFVWNEAAQRVERFAISFEQHSEGRPPALRGFVRYKSFYGADGLVLRNDTDIEGTPLEAVLSAGPKHGTVTQDANGALVYTPNLGFSGSDSFIYRASDGLLWSKPATVSIRVLDTFPAPEGTDDEFKTPEDKQLTGDVLANDLDHGYGPLTVTAVNGDTKAVGTAIRLRSRAMLSMNADGTFTYDPRTAFPDLAADEVAHDHFDYEFMDTNGGTSIARPHHGHR
jgi:hypothetical protein